MTDFFCDLPKIAGRRRKDPYSLNCVASFDIETTSFYQKGDKCISVEEFQELNPKKAKGFEKRACLCAWGFGLCGKVIYGRTWDEFIDLCEYLHERYQLDPENLIMPVYIHNESYEFQWIRKRFSWVRVFSVSDRYPIRALCSLGIEFRDSLIISGMSLESTAKLCLKYPCAKASGDWDYSKLRGSLTEISETEWGYLESDNVVVMHYLQELLEEFKSINRIPMTKTGFVRDDVRNACFWDGKSHKKDKNRKFLNYSKLMQSLTIDGEEEYSLMREAFTGGFTHANSLNANIIHEDVVSFDISSSYPAVICSEKFPMGKGEKFTPKSVDEFNYTLAHYCVLMDITLYKVESTFPYEHIISLSKCKEIENYSVDNGRVIRADMLRISITEVDFECFKKFYKWESMVYNRGYRYVRGYLPSAIVERTIYYYEGKTTLKGVEGEEGNYARLKTLVNSIFGCMVMDVVKNEISYDDEDEWSLVIKNIEEEINNYNNSKSRFLFYLWGVYICKYGMRNILSAQLECKEDHIYTDTDSEKCKHAEKHMKWIEAYNALIGRKIRRCLQYCNIDPERAFPKTINGKVKPLGVFEIDGHYKRFKTLGAKRYAVEYDEPENPSDPSSRYSLTISGVNKKVAVPEIYRRMQENGKDFFDYFKFGQIFDRKMCGKKLHTYIDDEIEGVLTDADGKKMKYRELSSVHLEETTYEMSASDDYISLLNTEHSIMYIE